MNIEEIQNSIDEKRAELEALKKQLRAAELEGCDYEGKFIEMPDYGRMYVTWQKLDESGAIYNDDRMFFQGIAYDCELCDYRDMSNFCYNAMDEWYIPLGTFKRWLDNGSIKEITEDEFVAGFIENTTKLAEEFKGQLIGCKLETELKKEEDQE